MKILLFGGTFDPPHNGHIHNLTAAIEAVRPDKAIVMPAGVPPHKTPSATPGERRLAMCECFKAVSPIVEISDWELKQEGESYTINTLEMLQETYPGAELYLAIGSDMLESFTKWRRWQDIIAKATLVVQGRGTDADAVVRKCVVALEYCHGRVISVPTEPLRCASSDIRTGRIPVSELPELLPPDVLDQIKKEKLYNIYKWEGEPHNEVRAGEETGQEESE